MGFYGFDPIFSDDIKTLDAGGGDVTPQFFDKTNIEFAGGRAVPRVGDDIGIELVRISGVAVGDVVIV